MIAYTREELEDLLIAAGFKNIVFYEPLSDVESDIDENLEIITAVK